MKHNLKVTLALITLFFVIQIFNLLLLYKESKVTITPSGNITVKFNETAIGERPEVRNVSLVLWIILGILVGTMLLLLIIKTQKISLWKIWYFIAIWLTSTISLGVFFPKIVAYSLGLVLSILKITLFNPLIHNIGEILVYSGISLLFSPLLNVFWATILLLIISIYDFIAVNKTKHMITLAKFQTSSRLFSGLIIPYHPKHLLSKNINIRFNGSKKGKTAIIGGGDIAFTLIFNSTVFQFYLGLGFNKAHSFLFTLIPVITCTLSLSFLLLFSKKDKFYPAMPFLSLGCFLGFLISLIFV